MIKKERLNYVIEVVFFLLSLFILVPVYMLLINSFKTSGDALTMSLSLPEEWHIIDNYVEMFDRGGVLIGIKNSFIVTLVSVTLIILLSSTTAFVLQRRKSRLSNGLLTFMIVGLIIPVQIIPSFFICRFFLLDDYIASIIMLTVSNLPFGIFLYVGYFKSIPTDIDESAIIDGAGPIRLFFTIIFPLVKPITVTLLIIAFMNVWNDFGTTIYFLNNSKEYTITLTMFNYFSTHSAEWNLVFANIIVGSIPVVFLYVALQKYIIKGMTEGAVKG